MIGIYKIINPKGKVYIGQSWDIVDRRKRYNRLACKKQVKLYNSIKKYGWNNHIFEVCHELPVDITQGILDNYEVLYYNLYKDCNIEMLNIKEPGKGGKHSPETIQKMKDRCWLKGKRREEFPMYGKIRTEESLKGCRRKVINAETGETYKSITFAAYVNNIPYSTLYHSLNGSLENKTKLKFLEKSRKDRKNI